MAERKISEMSIEELLLYRQQLSEKLTEVEVYLRNKSGHGKVDSTQLEGQITFSQITSKEEV